MVIFELLVLALAIVFAAPMVYGIYAGRQRRRGVEVTPFGVLVRAMWVWSRPGREVAGYLLKRAVAHQWQPTEEEKPALFRAHVETVYVYDDEPDPAPDTQTDTQTDPVSALSNAVRRLEVDRSRAALIDVMVLAGWDVGRIRSAVKGDNGTIGTEVAEARRRLGVDAPTRTITVNERIDGKPVTREVAL